jgi:aerobic carbon-monoxide dehydrogenase large subunit
MTMQGRKFGVGQPLKRVEDIRFVTGAGRYTSDVAERGELRAYFLRSPVAHANFSFSDLDAVRALPGVRAVYTAEDFPDFGGLPCLGTVNNGDGTKPSLNSYPVIATGKVVHIGDIVAMVVADTYLQARDAAEAIVVEWRDLPTVVDVEEAVLPGAPLVFEGAPGNVCYDTFIGDEAKADEVFARAARTVKIRIVNPRVVANYMEVRSVLAEYDSVADKFTLHTPSQGVHGLQGIVAGMIMKMPPDKLRVLTSDVGGGFGTKIFVYREYPLTLEAAKRLGKSIAWVADRTEHFLGDTQGRDNVTTAELALDETGKFLALKVDILGNLGAYLSSFAPFIPWLGASMATGCYEFEALHARVRGIYTHTVPVDAYRGAGRPEAAYLLERLVDAAAREIGMAPEEIRAKNFIKPTQMPYTTLTARHYDVGDFEGAMRACLAKADYAGFEARAAEAAARGKLLGFGFSSYIECTAFGSGEEGSVVLEKDGTFTVPIGTQSSGQGHETAYAQVIAEQFDVPPERVRVVQGDTSLIPTGNGTGGSRSIPVGAVMVTRASETLAKSLKELAADKLETAVADLEIADGAVRVVGTDRSVSFTEIAALPGATPDKLKGTESYVPADATYPNGTHCCEVEIDPDSGVTDIVRYTAVDDFGFTLNPLLLEGQVHGGIAQGAGQALFERAVYDQTGQLLTATFMDYNMPRADNLPSFDFETRNVASTTNPMGLKGAGEAGTIASTPAVMNAVQDALWRGYRIAHVDMPATPFVVFDAIRTATRRAAE